MNEDDEAGSNTFIISWDMLGLEAIVSTTAEEKKAMFDMIRGSSGYNQWLGRTVSMMTLRARMNPGRHYEIYLVHTSGGITEEDLRELFEANPQGAADMIRERGNQVYSDRAQPGTIKIQ